MTTKEKREAIKKHVTDMLAISHENMMRDIDRVLDCGAVDVDAWSAEHAPMVLPKCITIALIEKESTQYSAAGTVYEKLVKKEVRNIRRFV